MKRRQKRYSEAPAVERKVATMAVESTCNVVALTLADQRRGKATTEMCSQAWGYGEASLML